MVYCRLLKYTAGSHSRLHEGRHVTIAIEDLGDITVKVAIGYAPAR